MLVLYVTHHEIEAQFVADKILYLDQKNYGEPVKQIYYNDVMNFVETPPTLDIAKTFHFPKFNNICLCADKLPDIVIKKYSDDCSQTTNYLFFKSENIRINENAPITASVLNRSSLYTTSIVDTKVVILSNHPNDLIKGETYNFSIEGDALLYDANGNLREKVKILNNRVISKKEV